MKKILAILLSLSFGIQADIALSSPKVNVNEQGQFLIKFTVNSDSRIKSKDFLLNAVSYTQLTLPTILLV